MSTVMLLHGGSPVVVDEDEEEEYRRSRKTPANSFQWQAPLWRVQPETDQLPVNCSTAGSTVLRAARDGTNNTAWSECKSTYSLGLKKSPAHFGVGPAGKWVLLGIRKSKLPHTGVVGSGFFFMNYWCFVSCCFGSFVLIFVIVFDICDGGTLLGGAASPSPSPCGRCCFGWCLCGVAFPSCVVLPSHRCFWVLLVPPLGYCCFLPFFCVVLVCPSPSVGWLITMCSQKCSSSTVSRRPNFVVRRVCVLHFRDGQNELHAEISECHDTSCQSQFL